jgi:hypothetical protein
VRRGPVKCPRCGSGRVAPIVWGLPSPETVERSARGEVALGGCVIGEDDPEWECLGCGLRGEFTAERRGSKR